MAKNADRSAEIVIGPATEIPPAMGRGPHSLRWAALGAAPLAVAAVGAGLRARMRRALPVVDGPLAGPVRAPVRVVRDRWGIPHLQAADLLDLFTAQGMVHAQDRLWQIDFQRHLAQGRLS